MLDAAAYLWRTRAHPDAALRWLRRAVVGPRDRLDPAWNRAVITRLRARYARWLDAPDEATRLPARTFAQYLGLCADRTVASLVATELASLVVLPAWTARWLARSRRAPCGPRIRRDGVQVTDPVIFAKNPGLYAIPAELAGDDVARGRPAPPYLRGGDLALAMRAMAVAWRLSPRPHVQLLLKLLHDLAEVRPYLDAYDARYFLVYKEYSCASSVVTWLLHRHGVRAYDVMHGDTYLVSRDAFFELDRAYVWHPAYCELFEALEARAELVVSPHPDMAPAPPTRARRVGVAIPGLDHYLPAAGGPEGFHRALATELARLARYADVELRPHPLYAGDVALLGPLPPNVVVRDPTSTTARAFIDHNAIVVGTVSTILVHAALAGRKVVVIENPATAILRDHHFFYRLPGVEVVQMEHLADRIRACLAD